jgi:hypothetical protein
MSDDSDTVSQQPTEEDIAAHEATLGRLIEAATEEIRAQPPEIELARPEIEWNLWAIGPATWPAYGGGPTKVVRVGEWFYLTVVLWLNPFPSPGLPSACERVSTTACDYVIRLCTMDLCRVTTGPAGLNSTATVDLVAHQCYYFKTFYWQAQAGWEGLFEMNIAAWIRGCNGKVTPYAGFVTRVYDITSDIFYPTPPGQPPRWEFDLPIKFMVTA